MFTHAVAAVIIGFVIFVASQILYANEIISADSRNLCLTAFLVWVGIAAITFSLGTIQILKVIFNV